MAAIVAAAQPGTGRKPFTAWGRKDGLLARQPDLGEEFQGIGQTKMKDLIAQLMKSGKVVKDGDGYLRAAE